MSSRTIGVAAVLACLSLAASHTGGAQGISTSDRPSDRPIDLPDLQAPVEVPIYVAPQPRPSDPPPPGQSSFRVTITTVEFGGNEVFSDHRLQRVVAPWLGRSLRKSDLHDLRDAVTSLYQQEGYVTSGAILPDQPLRDGKLRLQIVEGKLSQVDVEGNRVLRSSAIQRRLLRGLADRPLNIHELEERLQILQRDTRIRRVRAHLKPGTQPGQSLLRTEISEKPAFWGELGVDDYLSPSGGDVRGTVDLEARSPTGYGDRLRLGYAGARGLQDIELFYDLPWLPTDTRVRLRGRYSQGKVVEAPFDILDLEARTITAGIELAQPLYQSAESELQLGLIGEWRRSTTTALGGRRIDLTEGSQDGRTQLAVMRPFLQLVHRDRKQLLALRTTLSVGVDALGATAHDGKREDGQFTAGLAQLQYFRRLPFFESDLLLRAIAQFTGDRLLPLERIAVGGHDTVRGYRENLLVRDNGWASSIELRVPIWRRGDGSAFVQIVPFLDAGNGWNSREPRRSQQLVSAGLGTRMRWRFAELSFFWGEQLKRVRAPASFGVQDRAFYFRVSLATD